MAHTFKDRVLKPPPTSPTTKRVDNPIPPVKKIPLLTYRTFVGTIPKKAHGGTVYRGRKYNYGGRVAKWHK